MSRDYFAVYGRLIRSPKFRKLSESAQLSLVYVWALAGDETPEATWPSRDALSDLLELSGRPAAAVDELLDRGWLDPLEDNAIAVHDWDDHQLAASITARRAYEASRKASWRRQPKGHVPDVSRTSGDMYQDETRRDETKEEETRLPSLSIDTSVPSLAGETRNGTGSIDGTGQATVMAAWAARGFKRPPTADQMTMLRPAIAERPADVAALIAAAPVTSGSGGRSFEVIRWVLSRLSDAPSTAKSSVPVLPFDDSLTCRFCRKARIPGEDTIVAAIDGTTTEVHARCLREAAS